MADVFETFTDFAIENQLMEFDGTGGDSNALVHLTD